MVFISSDSGSGVNRIESKNGYLDVGVARVALISVLHNKEGQKPNRDCGFTLGAFSFYLGSEAV